MKKNYNYLIKENKNLVFLWEKNERKKGSMELLPTL
jgi:hypothetical protein